MPVPSGPQRRFFVSRFWHGEYSLAFSYWAVGLIVTLTVGLLLVGVSFMMHHGAFNPYGVVAALVAIWGSTIAGLLFQSVGVWRSAARHRRVAAARGRPGLWGVAAQVVVVFGALGLGYIFLRQGMPQLAESWRMAFEGDPDIPPYALRLMRDDTEAEITGGFKYGLARDAGKLFARAPHLDVVHLNSGGGRLGEAIELARLIRARGLATYTSASCSSACTIAFAAGRERYLKSGAKLGFHRAIFAGVESSGEMRDLLSAAHIERSFVDRAVSQPAHSIWYPAEQELEAANVIMAVVDGYRFAASGLGPWPGLENFREALRRTPIFAAMEAADGKTFEAAAHLYERLYFKGTPDGRIADEIRSRQFAPLLRSRLALAPDGLLIDYARLMADQFDAVGARDAHACFALATQADDTTIARLLPPELRQRELQLAEETLRTPTSREPASAAELNQAMMALSETLVGRFGVDQVRLLANPAKAEPRQHAQFCRLSAAMFRAIAELPPAQAGTEMSAIFRAMARATPTK